MTIRQLSLIQRYVRETRDFFTPEERKKVELCTTTSLNHEDTGNLVDALMAIHQWQDIVLRDDERVVHQQYLDRAKSIIERIKI